MKTDFKKKIIHNYFITNTSKAFALKFRKTRNKLENVWEEENYEQTKYFSHENKMDYRSFIAHH